MLHAHLTDLFHKTVEMVSTPEGICSGMQIVFPFFRNSDWLCFHRNFLFSF